MARVEVWVIEDTSCRRNLHSRNNIKRHLTKYGDEEITRYIRQGLLAIDDLVYLDEIDEYVTVKEYADYIDYYNSKHNTNKD